MMLDGFAALLSRVLRCGGEEAAAGVPPDYRYGWDAVFVFEERVVYGLAIDGRSIAVVVVPMDPRS